MVVTTAVRIPVWPGSNPESRVYRLCSIHVKTGSLGYRVLKPHPTFNCWGLATNNFIKEYIYNIHAIYISNWQNIYTCVNHKYIYWSLILNFPIVIHAWCHFKGVYMLFQSAVNSNYSVRHAPNPVRELNWCHLSEPRLYRVELAMGAYHMCWGLSFLYISSTKELFLSSISHP